MKDSKNKARFGMIFTLSMCFVLALIALPFSFAYLQSKKYVGGTIKVATINLDVQNSSSTSIMGSTVNIGEADESDIYSYTAKIKNTGDAGVIVRFYIGLINSSGEVVNNIAIEPVPADGSGFSWVGKNGYYYLSTTTGARLTVEKDSSYTMLTGFVINDPLGSLDSYIDDDGNLTFGLQVQAVQYNIGSSLSSIWSSSDLPTGW